MIGLFFSFLAAISLYQSEKLAIKYELQKDVENTVLSLSRELNIGIELLYALKNQLTMVGDINQAKFVAFSEIAMSRHPNIRSLEWAEVVQGKNRALFEADVGKEFSGFSIVESDLRGELISAAARKRYFPVRYVSPYQSNEHVLGFDLASIAVIKNALEMSWYRGVPIATPAFRFRQELGSPIGFIMLLPVFNGDPETDAQRKLALRGFLLVRFDVKDIFELAISNTVKESINLELIDKGFNKNNQVIYSNLVDISAKEMKALSVISEPIFFAGREWAIRGIPSADYLHSRLSIASQMIFLVGVVIFSLLAYLIYSLQHRALNIQQCVDAKTRQLRQANSKLEKMSKSDGLTGYHNREYFDECIDAELKRAHRDGLPISLLMVEIDYMSDYNDKNGRVAGDRLIRLIGNAIAEVLKRPGDLLARYDGETFAVLLPNTKEGCPIGDLCFNAIKCLQIPFDSGVKEKTKQKSVTVSIGGVTVMETQEVSAHGLVTYSGIALGKAVMSGRNKAIWLYSPEKNQPPSKEADGVEQP